MLKNAGVLEEEDTKIEESREAVAREIETTAATGQLSCMRAGRQSPATRERGQSFVLLQERADSKEQNAAS
jgi:hypothetical protein